MPYEPSTLNPRTPNPPNLEPGTWTPELQVLQQPRAVAEVRLPYAGLVEHRDQQVGHRRVIRIPQVTPALHPARRAADDEVRQREVIVGVAVAHVAAVEQHGVVEDRAVAVRYVLQLLE